MSPELQFAVEAVRRAGALLVGFFRNHFEIGRKGKDNPVTSADLAADRLLRESFARQYPEDGWLSEETADFGDRLSRRRVWIVDPMDGTREFVQGISEFAISLALVCDGVAELAVVFNPARDDLFTAERGRGACRNGRRVTIASTSELQGARILGSRSEYAKNLLTPLESWGRVTPVGSIAYKLALVAASEADVTISLQPKSEWDVCGGSLVVEEAGGIFTDLAGRPRLFNQRVPRFFGVIAANPALHSLILQWVKDSDIDHAALC